MRLLVTGAAGFIGSTLTDRLLADGHEVLGVDDLSTGKLDNLAAARAINSERPGAFSFTNADVTTPAFAAVVRAAAPEVICHLAAQVDVRVSVADPVRDATLNVVGTVSVLEAARLAGARKVVYISSGGTIYGSPVKLPVSERSRLAPASPYAAGKAAGEYYLAAFQEMYGLTWTALALGNVYGPRQDPHGEAGVVAIFGTAMLLARPTKIFGDGTSTRDYVFVDDICDAIVRAADPGPADGRRLNIGTGRATPVRDIHSAVAHAACVADEPVFADPRLGELQAISLDPTAARQALGWEAWTELGEGIGRTVEWIRGTLF